MITQNYSFNLSSGDLLSFSVETDNIINERYNTYQKLQNLLKSHYLCPRFRFTLLNHDDTPKYEIPNSDILPNGNYQENYQNGVRRTLSLTFNNKSKKYSPSINGLWANSKISFEVGLEVPTNNATIWFKKGVYVLSKVSPSRSAKEQQVSTEWQDKFSIFEGKQGTIPETYRVEPGVEIKQIITDILAYNNGNGTSLDPVPFIYHSSFEGKTTPVTISGSEGQKWGSILKQLAEILSAEIFYNANGVLTVVPQEETTEDSTKPVMYDFDSLGASFVNDNFSFNVSDFINKVVVIGSNIDSHTVTAEAVNNDPSSPLSVQRIGYRVADPISDSNITNDILAQERANYELRKKILAEANLSSTIIFNPLLEVNNLVTYTDDFFTLKRNRFLIQSLSYSIGYEGTMNISATNLQNLPFVLT